MNQAYLDIARQYLAWTAETETLNEADLSQAPEAPAAVETLTPPISLSAYRDSASPRCRLCGHGMSVVAVSDICGRCATPRPATTSNPTQYTEEERLRSLPLVALDQRDYPKMQVGGGYVGPGLVAWCPVLRELNEAELRDLLRRLDDRKQTEEEEVGDDSIPGLW